jgi:succinoglycan biosynthesis transport protein ExoP
LELWRYYRILRRRKWLIVWGMAICIGVVAYTVWRTPQMFIGRVKVMERQQSQLGVQVYGPGYNFDPNLDIHLNDLGVIATSEKVLQSAARTLSLFNISVNPEYLLSTVKVEPVPNSQILKIEVVSSDREEAEAAADAVASEFQRVYREIKEEPTTNSVKFIKARLPVAEENLKHVRNELRQFKEQNKIVQLGQQSQIAIATASDYRNKLADAEVDQGQNSAYLDTMQKQLEQNPARFREVSSSINRNPFYDNLTQLLQTAQVELADQLAKRGEAHPDVIAARKRIAEITAKLADSENKSPMTRSGISSTLEPTHDTVKEGYLRARASYVASTARRNALAGVADKTDSMLNALPAKEMALAKLMVDQDAAEQTYRLLRQKLDEATIKESESKTSNAIKIIEEAHVYPVNQKKILKVVLAFLLSPMLSAAIVFLLNYLDNSIKTPAEAEELLGLPVFSVVPLSNRHSLVRHKGSEALGEIYQIFSANLWNNLNPSEGACLLVASAEPNTGRSVTASNLAVTLAADGARVILVDADLRQPVQHSIFGVDNKFGLTNVLGGGALLEDVLRPTKFDGLLLMTAGPVPDNPVRLLRSPQMKTLVEQISAVADFVIFDSPAGIAFADAGILASYLKNVLVVHAAGRVSRGAEAEFQGRLDQGGANMVGAVLNMVHPDDSHGYFHYRRAYQDVLPPEIRRTELQGPKNRKAIATGVSQSPQGDDTQ